MKFESEVRILEIHEEEWVKKLQEMGAVLEGEWLQKRKVYDFHPKIDNKWIRLRTNGQITTLAIKEVVDFDSIDCTRELEIEVSNFDDCAQILDELGYHYKSYQENKRIRYRINEIEIDLDTWPLLPTYAEIEGPSKESVEQFLKNFIFDKGKITTLDVDSIYRTIYQIDPDFKVLTFEEQIR